MGIKNIVYAVLRATIFTVVALIGATKGCLLILLYITTYIPLLLLLLSDADRILITGIIGKFDVGQLFVVALQSCVIFVRCSRWKFLSIVMAYICGARMMRGSERVRIHHILKELIDKASEKGVINGKNVVVDDFVIMIDKSDMVNAYVLGNRVICFTKGLLDACNDDYIIKGVAAHELGHVIHKDARVLQYVVSCNWFVYFLECPLRLNISICNMFLKIPFNWLRLIISIWLLPSLLVRFAMKIINYLADVIVCGISRYYEYQADAIAHELGASEGLQVFLQYLLDCSGKGNFFTELFDMHPLNEKRIAKLKAIQ